MYPDMYCIVTKFVILTRMYMLLFCAGWSREVLYNHKGFKRSDFGKALARCIMLNRSYKWLFRVCMKAEAHLSSDWMKW